ncbi:DUF4956 domain-containing protein [Planctomicrobium sp. SH664]|uniref:DUF4956 domain-containing protein n=1 Tax=Planctomicrobium sp. SH664 TaxID=3448125 RepID=UPI003F5AE3E0
MPDSLVTSADAPVLLPLVLITVRLLLGLVFGCLVAGSYWLTQPRLTTRSWSLMSTLVLLTILIGLVTLVIGNNVARAFSLVGTLSIVRFRTVVEDTRDTAFVIFAVAVGMAVGTGYYLAPVVGIPVTTLAAYLFRHREHGHPENSLTRQLNVRVGLGHDARQLLEPKFLAHLRQWDLASVATARQGTAFQLRYEVQLLTADSALTLAAELNRLEGVQEVEITS